MTDTGSFVHQILMLREVAAEAIVNIEVGVPGTDRQILI